MENYSIDELMCVCVAQQVADGDILAQGINTPLVMAGYLLAKATHAPNVTFASAIAPGIVTDSGQLGVGTIEQTWLKNAKMAVGFDTAVGELLPRYHPKEFFRPAQVQADGSTNNVMFGKDYAKPRLRLPGTGGIPDVTVYSDRFYLYVPRHSRVTFVKQVDIISGLGHVSHRIEGTGPQYLVSDLGQFDWRNGQMRLTHLHPNITMQQVQKKTGFPLQVAPHLSMTTPPTSDELHLLRKVIDPLGVRKLDTLSGATRRAHLQQILEHEGMW